MPALEAKKNIYWVGVLDKELRNFDIIMHTDYGTTYNSYLVRGSEKTVLFDTVKEDDIITEIEELDLGTMTPIDALNHLYKIQNKLRNRW